MTTEMDTGKALEIVHGMATRLLKQHGERGPAKSPEEAQEALDTVEDFIVNNFEEVDPLVGADAYALPAGTACYAGTDIKPQDGDIVAWISNGEQWKVCRKDDLEGPSALHHWPDGGWCGVRLVRRP